MATNTDRIEKSVLLHAPRERVWRAISDSKQFGTWFGVEFDGPFVAGTSIIGKMVPTRVDAEVARKTGTVPRISFRVSGRSGRTDAAVFFSMASVCGGFGRRLSKEPTTLVAFKLNEVSDGTKLTVTESGFDQIPLERRDKAFAANEGGWAAQMKLIEKYLAQHAKG